MMPENIQFSRDTKSGSWVYIAGNFDRKNQDSCEPAPGFLITARNRHSQGFLEVHLLGIRFYFLEEQPKLPLQETAEEISLLWPEQQRKDSETGGKKKVK